MQHTSQGCTASLRAADCMPSMEPYLLHSCSGHCALAVPLGSQHLKVLPRAAAQVAPSCAKPLPGCTMLAGTQCQAAASGQPDLALLPRRTGMALSPLLLIGMEMALLWRGRGTSGRRHGNHSAGHLPGTCTALAVAVGTSSFPVRTFVPCSVVLVISSAGVPTEANFNLHFPCGPHASWQG